MKDVSKNDSVELKASIDGLSLKGSGAAADSISSKLSDLVSPVTEIAGTAGDLIRALRIYSVTSLENTLLRAKQIEIESGGARHRISTKQLSGWAEGASAEDPTDSGNISELWARIFFSERKNGTNELLVFSQILKLITYKDANNFVKFMKVVNSDETLADLGGGYSDLTLLNSTQVSGTFRNIINLRSLDKSSVILDPVALSDPCYLFEQLIYFEVDSDGLATDNMYTHWDDENELNLLNTMRRLSSLGLFTQKMSNYSNQKIQISASYYEPTSLSFSFFDAIQGVDISISDDYL